MYFYFTPLISVYSKYQKLKFNNHALAKALSQEKQENQLLFSRNVELIAEQQNLIYACNQRDVSHNNPFQSFH